MIVPVSPTDYFVTKKQGFFNPGIFSYILDFYSPIVGIKATAIYLSLCNEKENVESKHASFFLRYQITSGDFQLALSPLEAIGLVKTFVKRSDEKNVFAYILFPPKNPREFADNELLLGTLRSYLSEEEVDAIFEKYKTKALPKGYVDITEKFNDVFRPELGKGFYGDGKLHFPGEESESASLGFDLNDFFKSLTELNPFITMDCFDRKEIDRIARIGTLYSYEETTMSSLVIQCFDRKMPVGSRVNFDSLQKLCISSWNKTYLKKELRIETTDSAVEGSSAPAKLFRHMEKVTPVIFLSELQSGHKPANKDVVLVDKLVNEYGLSHGATNALLLYVVKFRGLSLNPNYVTKIAATLVRKKISNALDTWNYLMIPFGNKPIDDTSCGVKIPSFLNDEKKQENIEEKEEVSAITNPEEESDEDFDWMLDNFKRGKK